jgi:hypothetical protein
VIRRQVVRFVNLPGGVLASASDPGARDVAAGGRSAAEQDDLRPPTRPEPLLAISA